ncbi:hypothetical protein HRI_001109900 [Hibiscus trionum]|uniref:Uncharacterized protein n=1 Tax=Hibiscus trionum TaxID=183268 RepID=A0A9W7LSL6_HIBTR|nr:hypothetical protein HRI_001109900 [Hibiscus trionum]
MGKLHDIGALSDCSFLTHEDKMDVIFIKCPDCLDLPGNIKLRPALTETGCLTYLTEKVNHNRPDCSLNHSKFINL